MPVIALLRGAMLDALWLVGWAVMFTVYAALFAFELVRLLYLLTALAVENSRASRS